MKSFIPKAVVGAAVIAIALTGCTAGTTSTSSTSASGADQTLVIADAAGVPTLDKESFGGSQMSAILTNTSEPLLHYKPSDTKSDDGADVASSTEFVAGLCETFSFSADGKTFDCKLGTQKSAYGNEITAADVKWSFDYAVAAGSTTLSLMNTMSMDVTNPVTVVSDKEVQLNFAEANASAQAGLTFSFFDPLDSVEVAKHVTAADPFGREWLADNSAGFGPYNVTSFTPSQEVRLAVNPNYVSPGNGIPDPSYGTVVYRTVADATTRAQLLKSGDVQLSKPLDLSMYPLLKDATNLHTYLFGYNANVVLYFNTQAAPFNDERVREAVACSIDKSAISEKTFYDVFPVAHTIMGKLASVNNTYDTCATPDPAKAASLLAAAGATDLTVTLTYSRANSGQDAQDNATLIQSMLKPAGITVNLVEEPDGSKFYTDSAAHQYEMFLETIGSNVPDPGWHLASWFSDGAFLNGGNISDPEITANIDLLKSTAANSPERLAASDKIQEIIMTQNLAVPIVELKNQYVLSNTVCGIQADPDDSLQWQFLKPCA